MTRKIITLFVVVDKDGDHSCSSEGFNDAMSRHDDDFGSDSPPYDCYRVDLSIAVPTAQIVELSATTAKDPESPPLGNALKIAPPE